VEFIEIPKSSQKESEKATKEKAIREEEVK
jgi:hypothetical protein